MENAEEFNEWHEDDLSFHKDTMVSFSQCTPDRNMSWTEILRFTSDNAGEDFTKRGMSWPFLMTKGIAFIVGRTSFHAYKMPVADQRISYITYEAAPQGPLNPRYYELRDTKTGELLIKAQTQWTILDVENRKIIPGKNFTFRPTPTRVEPFDGIPAGKIKVPEELEFLGKHKIRYSDLDANGHTNNSRYASFVFDFLPEEFQKKVYKDLRMNYSKETMLGEELTLKGKLFEEENKYTVVGFVGQETSFECELYW